MAAKRNPMRKFREVLRLRLEWPSSGFKSLEDARRWVDGFVNWYNTEHKHSKLRFVTPEERHEGKDVGILAQHQRMLEQARERTPGRRGTRPVRNCEPVGPTTLNPEKAVVEKTQLRRKNSANYLEKHRHGRGDRKAETVNYPLFRPRGYSYATAFSS